VFAVFESSSHLPLPKDKGILQSTVGPVIFSNTLKRVIFLLKNNVTGTKVIADHDNSNLVKCWSIEPTQIFSRGCFVSSYDNLVVISGHAFKCSLEEWKVHIVRVKEMLQLCHNMKPCVWHSGAPVVGLCYRISHEVNL